MGTVTLSGLAVGVLRLHAEGERRPRPAHARNLAAYPELVEAGIMEPVPGAERIYRLTAEGRVHREAIVERETERIERERYEPPDGDALSDGARKLLARMATGERVEIIEANRSAFRELAADRIVILGHSFRDGRESAYRWTYWGWRRRFELSGRAKEAV